MCGAPSSDLSWTWRLNQGRIFMAGQLLNLYPNVALQTYYAEVQGLVAGGNPCITTSSIPFCIIIARSFLLFLLGFELNEKK